MKQNSGKNFISTLAAVMMLAVFAAGILSVLLAGAGAYKRLTDRDALSYDRRTCAQYLTSKVRQAADPGAMMLSEFGDGTALILCEEIDGAEFWTQVYCHKGWLMELFTAADAGFAPEDGEKILPAQSLEITRSGGLMVLNVVDDKGRESSVLVTLRQGKGEGR